jgi:hypothetical protein
MVERFLRHTKHTLTFEFRTDRYTPQRLTCHADRSQLRVAPPEFGRQNDLAASFAKPKNLCYNGVILRRACNLGHRCSPYAQQAIGKPWRLAPRCDARWLSKRLSLDIVLVQVAKALCSVQYSALAIFFEEGDLSVCSAQTGARSEQERAIGMARRGSIEIARHPDGTWILVRPGQKEVNHRTIA